MEMKKIKLKKAILVQARHDGHVMTMDTDTGVYTEWRGPAGKVIKILSEWTGKKGMTIEEIRCEAGGRKPRKNGRDPVLHVLRGLVAKQIIDGAGILGSPSGSLRRSEILASSMPKSLFLGLTVAASFAWVGPAQAWPVIDCTNGGCPNMGPGSYCFATGPGTCPGDALEMCMVNPFPYDFTTTYDACCTSSVCS